MFHMPLAHEPCRLIDCLAIIAKAIAMTTTMNISLTEPLKRFVDQQVRDGGFSSTSDYVRDLIRERQKRSAEDHLRGLIAEGLASGPTVAVDKAGFAQMRKRAHARAAKRREYGPHRRIHSPANQSPTGC